MRRSQRDGIQKMIEISIHYDGIPKNNIIVLMKFS
jgi:hypothetical protein